MSPDSRSFIFFYSFSVRPIVSFVPVSEGDSTLSRLDTVDPGTGSPQPESEFTGLRVVNEPEEEEDMNDLRTRFMERHRKRLYETIDIVIPLAKKACPEKAQEDSAGKALPLTVPDPNVAGPSIAIVTQPDVAGPSTAAATQPNLAGPSSAPAAKKEAYRTEAGLDVATVEGGLE